MKNAYLSRQVFFAFNQFAIICYLGFMAAQNDFIQQNSFVHFLLLSFLIFDAEYISYKNVKGIQIPSDIFSFHEKAGANRQQYHGQYYNQKPLDRIKYPIQIF